MTFVAWGKGKGFFEWLPQLTSLRGGVGMGVGGRRGEGEGRRDGRTAMA